MILTWFKLRRRDLGAILNASGWAVNRPIRFSMARARGFTKCAKTSDAALYALLLALVVALLGWTAWGLFGASEKCQQQQNAGAAAVAASVPNTSEAK